MMVGKRDLWMVVPLESREVVEKVGKKEFPVAEQWVAWKVASLVVWMAVCLAVKMVGMRAVPSVDQSGSL